MRWFLEWDVASFVVLLVAVHFWGLSGNFAAVVWGGGLGPQIAELSRRWSGRHNG